MFFGDQIVSAFLATFYAYIVQLCQRQHQAIGGRLGWRCLATVVSERHYSQRRKSSQDDCFRGWYIVLTFILVL